MNLHRASQCSLAARRIALTGPIASFSQSQRGFYSFPSSQRSLESVEGREIREWRRRYWASALRDTRGRTEDHNYQYGSHFGGNTWTVFGLACWSIIGTLSLANQLRAQAEKTEEEETAEEEADDNTLVLSAAVLVRLRHFLSSQEFRSCVVDAFRKYENPDRPGRLQLEQLQPALEEIHTNIFPILCREVLQKQPGRIEEGRIVRDTKFSEQELQEWKQQANLQNQREFYFTEVEYLARNVAFTAVIVYQIIEQSHQYIIQDLKPLITVLTVTFVSGLAYMIYRKRQPPRPPRLTKSTRDKLRTLYKERD
eukprot:gb/GECG01000364.1/.p1 GENE.gb/GECG01000364.1/~~gb/GECG01000364.1/.p1  ORF type:complete len:311 (+),score=24.31 gb/GECG01000364.1/:1-933(+)